MVSPPPRRHIFCVVPGWQRPDLGPTAFFWAGFPLGTSIRLGCSRSNSERLPECQRFLPSLPVSTPISTTALTGCSHCCGSSRSRPIPLYKADCREAAEWLVADLKTIGFDASVRNTPGHPMVVAHHDGPAARRMCCFTGTTTSSRSIPLELWDDDPFSSALSRNWNPAARSSPAAAPPTTRGS